VNSTVEHPVERGLVAHAEVADVHVGGLSTP
jgi:hypothetical protein